MIIGNFKFCYLLLDGADMPMNFFINESTFMKLSIPKYLNTVHILASSIFVITRHQMALQISYLFTNSVLYG